MSGTRIGSGATILHLHGSIQGGAMILSGEIKNANGTIRNRITWTPLPEGKVKQEWSTSSDSGSNWQTAFVGIYEKQ